MWQIPSYVGVIENPPPFANVNGHRWEEFLKLKLIKTYLRSTMADDRISSLAISSIENKIASSLDMSQDVAQFALLKVRKVAFYGIWHG